MSEALLRRSAEVASLAHAICRAMQQEVIRLGIGRVYVDDPANAEYRPRFAEFSFNANPAPGGANF